MRSDYIRVRLNEEEKKAIKSKAEKAGLTLSDYVRSCCLFDGMELVKTLVYYTKDYNAATKVNSDSVTSSVLFGKIIGLINVLEKHTTVRYSLDGQLIKEILVNDVVIFKEEENE